MADVQLEARRGIGALADAVVDSVETAVVGKRGVINQAVATLLSQGHLLLEDIPGVGKTTLAKALAKAIGGEFRRIQFTPDLVPSDITGSSVLDRETGAFRFVPGPIFGNVVLADEINRATPKTQSALLEAMEEHQVTIDGVTRPLPLPFFVIATQNQIDMTGTYPLPEAQLDRFFSRLSLGYPDRDSELTILANQRNDRPLDRVTQVLGPTDVTTLQNSVREVHAGEAQRAYIVDLVRATRETGALRSGASPRGSLNLLRGAQALAAMDGRDHVQTDDVKAMAVSVLAHRVIARAGTGDGASESIRQILQSLPQPDGRK